uniref:Uncharacterized protein n=1 Tax=Nothoprocta perdicaria TaxID=30464 RepID=A0A8C6ZUJ6_NOTPE
DSEKKKRNSSCLRGASPCSFSVSPCSFSASPCSFSASPCSFSASPCSFSASPCSFSASPCSFSVSPCSFSVEMWLAEAVRILFGGSCSAQATVPQSYDNGWYLCLSLDPTGGSLQM